MNLDLSLAVSPSSMNPSTSSKIVECVDAKLPIATAVSPACIDYKLRSFGFSCMCATVAEESSKVTWVSTPTRYSWKRVEPPRVSQG